MTGHHRSASETPFKWRIAGGPIMTRLKWYLPPLKIKKNVKIGPPLTKLSRSAHEPNWMYKDCLYVYALSNNIS